MSDTTLRLSDILTLRAVEDSATERYSLCFESNERVLARCRQPLAVLYYAGAEPVWVRDTYRHVAVAAETVVASGVVIIGGSTVAFSDSLSVSDGGLHIDRRVEVIGDSAGHGFLSAMEWTFENASLEDSWFIPGIWYGRNRQVPPYAIGAPLARTEEDYIVFREDRLPLPLVSHLDENGLIELTIMHADAAGETVRADDDDEPLIERRLTFGSFGLYDHGETVAFWYPGTEGQRSYPPMWTVERGNRQANSPVNPFSTKSAVGDPSQWVYRFHPLTNQFRQRYKLLLTAHVLAPHEYHGDRAWRRAFAEYRPAVHTVDLGMVERASLRLIERMTIRRGGAVGIPTWLDCFTGRPGEFQDTFGIGFVGRNLEAARILLRFGRRDGREELSELGAEILDFWVNNGGKGLSHTEYDPATGAWIDGGSTGGSTFVYLRDQSDSHRACLQAFEEEKSRGHLHPTWQDWAVGYGAWLVENQNPDGSFHRAYHVDGFPARTSSIDCVHVIPLLLALPAREGSNRFLACAKRVAEYLLANYHGQREYAGGTLDNPECTDKEASALAMEAYLALFEATGEAKWLIAAEDAAKTCETWIFQWRIPMPIDDPNRFFPSTGTTVGFQLITTGFSAFDMYLTRHVGDYARLATYTGDPHYWQLARILLHNTKTTLQLEDEHGYAAPGFQIEHWSAGRGRGYGLNSGWLPWVATSHIVSIEQARRWLPDKGTERT